MLLSKGFSEKEEEDTVQPLSKSLPIELKGAVKSQV